MDRMICNIIETNVKIDGKNVVFCAAACRFCPVFPIAGRSAVFVRKWQKVWKVFAFRASETKTQQFFSLALGSKGEGWAVANRWANAIKPESHGILLHFANGVWQQRGWAWSPLRQRWFGLLGGLR